MWLTNRMLFDHPLYGLNIDRVLGFHDYTLGQVTTSTDRDLSLSSPLDDERLKTWAPEKEFLVHETLFRNGFIIIDLSKLFAGNLTIPVLPCARFPFVLPGR